MDNRKCKVVLYNNDLVLTDPNGNMLPWQIDVQLNSALSNPITATVTLYVEIDAPVLTKEESEFV